jgi:tRNA pseudouridine38-40 synthase
VQPGLRTVQGVLQGVLAHITGESIVVEFAGRTDAGVHATGQVVSFDTAFRHGPYRLERAVNALSPSDVAVREAEAVEPGFHARRSARGRWYRYTVHNGRGPRPMLDRYSYFFPRSLDVEAMNAAGAELLGTHDFIAFGDVPGNRPSSVRRLDQVEARREGDMVTIDLRASAFLKHMARSMAGLLLRAGTHGIEPEGVRRVLEDRDRHKAGPVAPAKGLCLMGVEYDTVPSPTAPARTAGLGEG